MYQQELRGTYYQMGLQSGRAFEKRLNEFHEQGKLGFIPRTFNDKQVQLATQFREQMHQFCPSVLEELEGFAEGAGIDPIHHLAQECTPARLQTQCMIIAASGKHTVDGKPLFLKNQEWLETDADYMSICRSLPEQNYNSFGLTFFAANNTRYGGINEHGLTISSISASFDHKYPGVMFNVAIRWILDHCKTTKEAVAFLEKIPRVWGTVYVIMDKEETIAVVESHRSDIVTRYSKTGFEMVTFGFLSDSLLKYNNPEIKKLIELRKKKIETWFKSHGKISEDMLMDLAADHESAICDHCNDGKSFYGTSWSYILSPAKDYAMIAQGPPCKNEYKKHELDLVLTHQIKTE